MTFFQDFWRRGNVLLITHWQPSFVCIKIDARNKQQFLLRVECFEWFFWCPKGTQAQQIFPLGVSLTWMKVVWAYPWDLPFGNLKAKKFWKVSLRLDLSFNDFVKRASRLPQVCVDIFPKSNSSHAYKFLIWALLDFAFNCQLKGIYENLFY